MAFRTKLLEALPELFESCLEWVALLRFFLVGLLEVAPLRTELLEAEFEVAALCLFIPGESPC